MSDTRYRVLIIEDEVTFLDEYIEQLEIEDRYDVDGAEDIDEARELLGKSEYAVVLTDVKLQTVYDGGLMILEEVKSSYPDTQVILFSGVAGTDQARQAERFRNDGWLTKPLDFDRLRQVVASSIQSYEQRKRIVAKRGRRRGRRRELPTPETFVHASRVMSDLANKAARVAAATDNIMIYGEPGTGKGLIAEGIHFGSGRPHFELVNCGSLSERSLEQILFGGEEGTEPESSGMIARINGGTLVLDRISGLSIRLQERLLGVINDGEIRTRGDSAALDLRIISIDSADLAESVGQRLFLEPLYEHLAQVKLSVPPLRERYDGTRRDALILADHFISKYTAESERDHMPVLSSDAELVFKTYPFPGNVAELENVIRVALDRATNGEIRIEHLLPRLRSYGVSTGLGIPEEGTQPVQCPHGAFRCNRTAAISRAYQSLDGVYLHLEVDTENLSERLQRKMSELGKTVLRREQYKDALVPMCDFCVPIQSCHYAVIDVSRADAQTTYEVGLLHALGVPVFTFADRNLTDQVPLSLDLISTDADEITSEVGAWLAAR